MTVILHVCNVGHKLLLIQFWGYRWSRSAIDGTSRFTAPFTTARNLSLFLGKRLQLTPWHHNFKTFLCSIHCLYLGSVSHSKVSCTLHFTYACYMWQGLVQLVETLHYKPEGRGSIPDSVIGIFQWHNPSGRTMALGSTQPLTEMSTRNIYWRLRRPVRRAENLTTFMCRLSWNVGSLNLLAPSGPVQACVVTWL
jgi:hypothetical protein